MTKLRLAWCFLVLLVAIAGCTATLSSFDVPGLVWAGHEFEIVVRGTGTPTSMQGSNFACVLQVPNGFTITSSMSTASPPVPIRDDPAILALYTAEPGHYLASFMGYISSPGGALGVMLRAPTTAGGPHVFKVSLVSGMQITDPPGVGNFAAITAPTHSKALTLVADPATRFESARDGLPVPVAYSPRGVGCGDLDLDGNDDLLLATVAGYRTFLSRPGAPWLGRAPTGITSSSTNARTAIGDFNGDSLPDFADPSGRIFHGDGQGNWTPGPQLQLPGVVIGVAVGDFDRDGRDDVAFSGLTQPNIEFVQVFRNLGSGTFAPASNGLPSLVTSSPSGGNDLVMTDATGDGNLDLIWTPSGTPNVWAGDGQGNWTAGQGLPVSAHGGIAVGDVTGDGAVEVVLAAEPRGWGTLEVFTHLGGNQWAALPGTGLLTQRGAIALLDFDRDGWLDLVTSDGGILLWRNLGGGTFSLAQDTGLPTFARDVHLAVGDFDGNTFPDLVATIGGMPTVWLNLGTGLSPYGAPCSAVGFPTPMLGANGLPQRGNAGFAVELRNGLPNGVGLMWIGLSRRFAHGQIVLPLPLAAFGAPGCTLLAEDLAIHFRTFDAVGFAALPLPIPNDPSLVRATLFGQAATYVPGANALGALFTGGLALRIE